MRLEACLNTDDYRALAMRKLPRPVAAFLEGGAEDERTMARNRAAFGDWALVPRALSDVSRVDASAKLLGQRLAWPFVIGPTGMPGLFHPDGEAGVARAAAAVGAIYTLSTMATQSIEAVAEATDAPKAFQLYIFRDREITTELIQRAREAGYAALVLTVDIQVPANRERDKRTGMLIPPRFTGRTVFDFSLKPFWCWNALVRRPMELANFAGRRAVPGSTLLSFINDQFDPSTTWADVAWVARQWDGPIALKGVLRPSDAAAAVEHGCSAVILSNHGGRQLDAAVSPMDVLEETVAAVGGRAEIILDGGVRRGTDMMKALALGAKGCMSGRVGLYGLAAGGTAGAVRALQSLRTEFERDLALLGARSARELDASFVKRVA